MGGCVSTPRGSCASRSRVKRSTGNMKRRWRGVVVKNKKKNRIVGNSKFPSSSDVVVELSDSSISIAGSTAEVWFEPSSLFGSDSEDEFHSGPEGTVWKNINREKDESSTALPQIPGTSQMIVASYACSVPAPTCHLLLKVGSYTRWC